jgi:LPXTG-motif cell wall-anchored protein
MTLRLPLLAALLAAAGLAARPAAAATITVAPGVTVSSISVYPDYWPYGYLDHRYLVENRSAQRLTLTLSRPENRYGGGLQSIARTLVADPGATLRVSLPQPPMRLSGDDQLVVRVHGGEQKAGHLQSIPNMEWDTSSGAYGLLISRALSAESLAALFESNNVHKAASRSSSSKVQNITRPDQEVDAWSPDWRAYTPYVGVLLAGRDWTRVPAEVRDALFSYVRAGGILIMAGPVDAADPLPIPSTAWSNATGRLHAPHGFGSVMVVDKPDPGTWTTNVCLSLHNAFLAADEPWRKKPDFDDAHRACPVVSGIRVPARAFFLTLLGFALLAGPGVLFYTRRRNNRLLRFILIPALSLVTTAGIVAFALLHEGWSPALRLESLTWLDPATQRAVTVGSVGAYAPFTPADGLRFDTETELLPLGDFISSYRMPQCTLNWSRCQHLDSGWLRPRVPTYFHVRRSEKRLERLIVTRTPDGAYEAVNALGGPIRALTLHSPDDRFLRSGPIPAGGRATLELVPKTDTPHGLSATVQLAESLKRRGNNWGIESLWFNPTNAPPVPEPGRFIALLDSCPFLETPMTVGATVQARAAVVGTFQVEPAPGAPAPGDQP